MSVHDCAHNKSNLLQSEIIFVPRNQTAGAEILRAAALSLVYSTAE